MNNSAGSENQAGSQLNGDQLHQRQLDRKNYNAPVIICDHIQTPENFGSILRVADAAGSSKVILLDSKLDLRNKKLSRLARKTEKHLCIEQYTFDQFLKIRKLFNVLYALEITSHSKNLLGTDISHCDGIVVGHESEGICEKLLKICDGAIHLPMFGTNSSMNISHALNVFLYEWRRQETTQLVNSTNTGYLPSQG